MNDLTLKLIIQAVDLATKDIDGVHEKLQKLGDELTKNEFSRSAEGMQAFSDSVKGATQPLADAAKNTLALSAAITGVASYMAGQAYQSAVGYESALADLAKVIDGGMESAKRYGDQLNQMALKYGQNGQQLVQAMANFVQAGYDADEAFKLVEHSVKLMIAGEVDAGEASQQLVSILKGFKEPADQAGRAVDILNEVSNKYATNVKELATGMAAISPIAKQMGFSMEETAGLLTPVIEVYQSGSEAADALKTGLQKLTDNAHPVKEALASIGVSQMDLNGNMRSGKEIFLDVAKSMVGLTDAQKQYVISQLVGIEQAGRMSQVFDNLAGYLGVTEVALGATTAGLDGLGSAATEVNARLATAEASNKRAAESFRQLGVTLGNALKPQITGVIDATGNLAKAFDGAVKSGNLAPLLNVIKPQIAAIENLFQAMAKNLDGALAGVDWTPLVNGLKELSGEFGEAFAALTDGMDLMTQSGLQEFLQRLINLMGNFTQYVAGIVDGLEPFIDGLNALSGAVSTNLPGFSKLIGQIQGLSLSINQGLPFILELGSKIFSVVGAIVDWTVKIGLLIGALKLLSAAGLPVGAMLTGLVTQFLALNPAMAGVLAGLAGMPGLVLALVGVAGGLGVAIGTLINKTVEWATEGRSIGTMLYDWTHAGDAARLGLDGLTDAQRKATDGVKDARIEYATGRITLEEYNAALENYKKAFGGLTEAQVAARAELVKLNADYLSGKATLQELVTAQADYLAMFAPTTDAQKTAKTALDAVVAAQKDGKATLVDVVAEQKNYLDKINEQIAADLARLKPIKDVTEGVKARTQAEQDAAANAEKQAKANQAKIDLDNQQNETNAKLTASFAALGLVYDANTGEILHQNQLTAAQRQAQLELGQALDTVGVAAGAMSGRITAAGEEMLATFNKIAANSQATSTQITAAFLAMIPKAETNAELEAIRIKIEKLAKQGKISGDEAASGLAAIAIRAKEVAQDPAFDVLKNVLASIREETDKGIEVGNREYESLQKRTQSAIELAKAKGDEAEAARLSAAATQEEAEQAERHIRQYQQQQTEIDAHIQRLYAQANADGIYTEAEREAIEALKDKSVAVGHEIQQIDAKLPLMEKEAQQAQIMAGPIGQLTRLYQEQTQEHERAADASQRYHDAQVTEAEGALKLAEIAGDEVAKEKALLEARNAKIAQAENLAAIRAQEAADTEKAISAKVMEMAADGEWTKADQQAEDQLRATTAAKQDAAEAAQRNVDQIKAETAATEEKAAADERAAAAAAKEKEATEQRAAAGSAVNAQWSAANRVLQETGGNIEKLNAAFIKNQEAYSRNAQDFIDWSRRTAVAADEVVQAYNSQKTTLEQTTGVLEKYAQTGEWTSAVQRAMVAASGDLESKFALLDTQDFDRLRGALDSANGKLRQMQEETQSAKDRLAELNAQLLEAQGQDQKAKLLREQLDYQQQLAEIEKQRAEAEAMGNRELLAILNDQQATLDKIHATKLRNIQADEEAAASTGRTATTLSRLADEGERAYAATQSLAGVNLAGLIEGSGKALANFQAIKGLM